MTAGPSLVGMPGHRARAVRRRDPTVLLRDYRAMVRHVHVKDCDLGVLDAVRRPVAG